MKYVKNFFSISWMMTIRFFQIIWTLTIGIGLFMMVMIAVEAIFTGKDFIKLFTK